MNRKRAIRPVLWPLVALIVVTLGTVAYTANQKHDEGYATAANADSREASPAQHDGHDHAIGESHGQVSDAQGTQKEDHADHDPAKEGADEAGLHEGHESDEEAEEGHADEVTLAPEIIEKNGIKIEPARRQLLSGTYTVPARISYNTEQMAHIGTPVEGRVSEIKARLGDLVNKGDTLLVIDSPALGEAQSDFLQKRMQVQVAQSALEVAQTAAERAKRLFDGNGISLGEYQRREGDFKAARGGLRTAEAAVTAAENKLHLWGMKQADVARLLKTSEIDPRFVVYAPISGTVVSREATLGEVVGPDRESLLMLADMKKLWVLADVPENNVKHIAVGTSASVSVTALGSQPLVGKVSYIAPELNTGTRAAQVRVEVENGHSPLKPGMFAQVEIGGPAASGQEAVLAVPEEAIQTVEGSPAVFVAVAGEDNTFAKRPVKVGRAANGTVPILAGLKEGENLVVSGSFILKAELGKGSAGHEH